jgi:hypothetical protein
VKYIPFILAIILCACPLLAQQPTIFYLMCDEAKSQLQIRGSFGVDSGSVTIEDTTLGIISWSDSLIICSLPDSGKGVGGHVVVKTVKGVSNARALSIIYLEIVYELQQQESNGYWVTIGGLEWHFNFRADITSRTSHFSSSFPFEASKISYGTIDGGHHIPWNDSSNFKDTGISVSGTVDLNLQNIILKRIYFAFVTQPGDFKSSAPGIMLKFDSLGFLSSAIDSIFANSGSQLKIYLYTGHILFPPFTKNAVSDLSQSNVNPINIFTNDHSILLQSTSPLGSTTASLYTIDGRLLKRTKLDISAPGIYTLDARDVHSHFALLVLQTEKGVITRKILF